MRRHLEFCFVILAAIPPALSGLVATASVRASDEKPSWVFRRSTYTHHPATGHRVTKYAQEQTKIVRFDPTYQQSGYRHTRSGYQFGGTYDFLHVVETWGEGDSIRPYGEWLYPYRAGATPYGPWGNPQGPWTTPFGAWENPYGLGRLPWGAWGQSHYPPGPGPMPLGPGGHGPGGHGAHGGHSDPGGLGGGPMGPEHGVMEY